MAIEERDREDLLRDGSAMLVRGEVVSDELELLIGFRAENQGSLYCGPERVFQFDVQGRIRRVFFDGRKFAAADSFFDDYEVILNGDIRVDYFYYHATKLHKEKEDSNG